MKSARAGSFVPPTISACFYVGSVMHARMKPVLHRFSYNVFSILVDLAKLNEARRISSFFSINRFNLLSLYERDHGPKDGSSLHHYAHHLFKSAGVELDGGKVLLLCYPRIFGYVFNPLSVYFGYSSAGELKGVLYEVRNTFGQSHTYIEPVEPGMLTKSGLRQERVKRFYVSPFNGLNMTYLFRVKPPQDSIAVRILVKDDEGPVLAASFHGDMRPLTTPNLLWLCLTLPFLTLKIIAGIHVEAFWLWVKGMRLVPRPPPPPEIGFPEDK